MAKSKIAVGGNCEVDMESVNKLQGHYCSNLPWAWKYE